MKIKIFIILACSFLIICCGQNNDKSGSEGAVAKQKPRVNSIWKGAPIRDWSKISNSQSISVVYDSIASIFKENLFYRFSYVTGIRDAHWVRELFDISGFALDSLQKSKLYQDIWFALGKEMQIKVQQKDSAKFVSIAESVAPTYQLFQVSDVKAQQEAFSKISRNDFVENTAKLFAWKFLVKAYLDQRERGWWLHPEYYLLGFGEKLWRQQELFNDSSKQEVVRDYAKFLSARRDSLKQEVIKARNSLAGRNRQYCRNLMQLKTGEWSRFKPLDDSSFSPVSKNWIYHRFVHRSGSGRKAKIEDKILYHANWSLIRNGQLAKEIMNTRSTQQPGMQVISKLFPAFQASFLSMEEGDIIETVMLDSLLFGDEGTKIIPPGACTFARFELVKVRPDSVDIANAQQKAVEYWRKKSKSGKK